MSIHTAGWAAIASSITTIVSIGATIWFASRNRGLVIEQAANQAKQATATLNVQKTTTARTAATFIAEKRQKWIDDLRDDVSQYMALSLELTEAYKRTFSRLGSRWDRFPPQTQDALDEFDDEMMQFQTSIADRNSHHYQLLTRILLRVNHNELAHKGLITSLSKVRSLLGDVAINAARQVYGNQEQYADIEHQLQFAQGYAKAIFHEEWRKLKREVADPGQTMDIILATRAPDDAAVKALVDASAASVPSFFSNEHILPKSFATIVSTSASENKPTSELA
ncbi:hypothetical protein H3O04_33355 [Burkholderia sp. KCJ3K979]|uniref:hypothetical protein n=1 Tax=Burkholderia sp. KCJ3K979 TaxID=2759149 RepID=UPI001929D49B|nr:hypothetical protein [Burkholderia sp. KCJ3K979]MBL3967363.1 hypothetical protein [Burkholderia sp. KCJ3K979]